jgi:LysR family transcriptional regulator for metE and metH
MRLTPAGAALRQVADRVLAELARAEIDCQRMSGGVSEVVRIGVATYSCYHWLPRFLELAHAELPHVQLELVALATRRPLRTLHDGTVDVVLAPAHQSQPGIAATPAFEDELVLVTHPGHPLAGREHIDPGHLRDQTYYTYSRTPEPGFEYERFIRPSGVLPRFVTSVDLTDAVMELVAAGFGVSILSRWATANSVAGGRLATVRCGRDGLALSWAALVREEQAAGSAARAVASLLAAWLVRQYSRPGRSGAQVRSPRGRPRDGSESDG